jgi:hypothetical protein
LTHQLTWGLAVKAGADFAARLAKEAGGLQVSDQKYTALLRSFLLPDRLGLFLSASRVIRSTSSRLDGLPQ